MDAAELESWLRGIAALTLLQRRQAWRTLGLSEAANCDGIETGVPAGGRIGSAGEQAGREEAAVPPPSNLVGADVVAALGQRRIDSIGCPHCDSRHVVRWGTASAIPRYRCAGCRRTFNALTKTPLANLRMKVTTQVAYLPSNLDMLGRKDRTPQISWPIGGLGADSN